MLSTITLMCRPTKDPEMMTSKSGTNFVRLDLATNKGYGDKEHPNYYQGYLKNDAAERLMKAGVKKGSLLIVTGDLDISTYKKADGSTGVSNNINVFDWGYASSGKPKSDENGTTQTAGSAQTNYTPSAYQTLAAPTGTPQFEEIGPDDDLPF